MYGNTIWLAGKACGYTAAGCAEAPLAASGPECQPWLSGACRPVLCHQTMLLGFVSLTANYVIVFLSGSLEVQVWRTRFHRVLATTTAQPSTVARHLPVTGLARHRRQQ